MNPHLYEEYRLRHRRFGEYFRRTLIIGFVPLGLAVWLAFIHFPSVGPGLFANAGLCTAGLLLLWAARAMHRVPPRAAWGGRLAARGDALIPALLIGTQGWFVLLTAMLIWFTIIELGVNANPVQHILLVATLVLIPSRRIVDGTTPQQASPWRELFSEGLGYAHVCCATLFLATVFSTAILPPDKPLTDKLPPGVVIVWMAAVLTLLTCLILFLDHIVRKMPSTPQTEARDTLD